MSDVTCIDTDADERCAQLEELVERDGTASSVFVEDAAALRKDGALCFTRVCLPVMFAARTWFWSMTFDFQIDIFQAFVSICMASLGGRAGTTLSGAGGGGAAIASWLFKTPLSAVD